MNSFGSSMSKVIGQMQAAVGATLAQGNES